MTRFSDTILFTIRDGDESCRVTAEITQLLYMFASIRLPQTSKPLKLPVKNV